MLGNKSYLSLSPEAEEPDAPPGKKSLPKGAVHAHQTVQRVVESMGYHTPQTHAPEEVRRMAKE